MASPPVAGGRRLTAPPVGLGDQSGPSWSPSWKRLVTGSAALLVALAVALAVMWVTSRETRITTYSVIGGVSSIDLDLRAGSADILGGASLTEVRRTEQVAYGRRAREQRSLVNGVLRISSRCPAIVIGTCSADYRLSVPDNVPLTVHTADGAIHVTALRGSADLETGAGAVAVDGFCGFSLTIKTGSGPARASASCSPQQLLMRSTSGNLEATVPAGAYRVEADSNHGHSRLIGLSNSADAPFEIQALSNSGDVTVRTGA